MKTPILFALSLLVCTGLQAQPATTPSYELTPGKPKYVTAMIEFSDPSGKAWPTLFVGKPSEDGQMVPDKQDPLFTGSILCDTAPQSGGLQTRRILGELFTPSEGGRNQSPAVSFVYQTMKRLEYPAKDKKGKENSRLGQAEVEGTLTIAGKAVPFQGTVELRFEGGKEGVPSEVHCHASGMVDAAALGLKNFQGPVKIRIFTMAYVRGASPVKK